ncbi:MAG: hypothetical protein JRI95_05305 [Deltaproteobacteria bacterium]|nr:hypothetical protein [Deltaproteobacteria bacterium]
MKRIMPAVLALLFLSSCATQEKGISYKTDTEKPLTVKRIYLQVKDMRPVKEILSPKVKQMKIWSGTGSVINLFERTAKPDEEKTATTDIKQDFTDALNLRLSNLGVSVIQQPSKEIVTLTLEIEKVLLDLVGSNFKAEVTFFAKVYRQGKVFYQERVSGRTEKYNLLGQKTGQKTLSEAFSLAVNNLDVKSFLTK